MIIKTLIDQDGKVLPELITDQGQVSIVQLISYITEPSRDRENRNEKLTINQLRKFYDSFLRVFNNNLSEKEKKIQLLMLKANSSYSAKRLNTNRFNSIFGNRIDLVVKENGDLFIKNLTAFKLHLEALVAYYPKR